MTQSSAFETRHTYTIHGKIASGGMGTIRLGLQLVARGFSRVVAIKQIHAMYANNQEFVAMFRDELRVASRVVHPNVVPILDVRSADDELSLIMEYVHGLSVARLLTSAGCASPEIATTIMIGMLHGLHAAHEALSENGDCLNIVHRDVSPHNVMVGIDGTPRVLDFGIAHALGRSRTTTVGQIKGKAKYLAPEQLMGESIDRRADIYSASVVFWEMLTGRRLFRSEKDDRFDLASRLSVQGPHLIQPGISPHLSRIVLRGLQPDPEARYATALDMAVALEEGAATVSATKVGEWVKRVWGDAGLARLQQIRAIEGGVRGTSAPDENRGRDHDHQQTTVNGEIVAPLESSEAQMTVPGRRLGRFARQSEAEPTISCESEDSLFGPRREMPPFLAPFAVREPAGQRDETPPAVSPWPVNRSVSPARMRGRVVTLAAFLVPLGSALAFFFMHRAGLPATRAPIAASGNPAADLQTPPPAHVSSIRVIEIATPPPPPPSPSPLAPDAGPPSNDPSPGNTSEPARPRLARVAASRPASSNHRVAQTPRRHGVSVGRAKTRSASGIASSRSVPRQLAPTESAAAVAEPTGEEGGEKGAAQPPVPTPPSCDPPYVIDDDGIKRFKLSCL